MALVSAPLLSNPAAAEPQMNARNYCGSVFDAATEAREQDFLNHQAFFNHLWPTAS